MTENRHTPTDEKSAGSRFGRHDEEDVLAGSVRRVIFFNQDNGYAVLRTDVREHKDPVVIVGFIAEIKNGDWFRAKGSWENDRKFGRQFRASFIVQAEPDTTEAIASYLRSNLIDGIGEVYAQKLVEAFGDQVFDVIAKEPERLREVPGIGRVRAASIVNAFAEQSGVREIMLFLHTHGVGARRAVRIYQVYGADAIPIISQNPYRLARDIHGIGFVTADTIAHSVGIEADSMIRIRAGILHALDLAINDGHCGLPRDELLERAVGLLEVSTDRAGDALDHEYRAGTIIAGMVAETQCYFPAHLFRAERDIANRLVTLMRGHRPWKGIDVDHAVPWAEQQTQLKFAHSQLQAIRKALLSKVLIITGGPGVGKTTIVNAILKILLANKTKIELCAPTGRAAKRLAETTEMDARTIHRLLEFDPIHRLFNRNAQTPLECDLVVVDEASMVDVPLMHALSLAIPDTAALLIVGDVDQLPSVGPGQVLSDMIRSGKLPVVALTEVFRQAAQSRIVSSAHQVNQGQMPDLAKPDAESDFYFARCRSPQTAPDLVLELVRNRIPKRFGFDPVRDIQVLCPMNRGPAGTHALNAELQKVLNPVTGPRITRSGWTFSRGDKVMQIVNDYENDVFNGDVGFVIDADEAEQKIRVDFYGRQVEYFSRHLDMLVLAYATTIHKSQGSEYPAVVIPLLKQHFIMLRRNLLYTAMTRGRKLVVLVGERDAVSIAVRDVSVRTRWTRLHSWLMEQPEELELD